MPGVVKDLAPSPGNQKNAEFSSFMLKPNQRRGDDDISCRGIEDATREKSILKHLSPESSLFLGVFGIFLTLGKLVHQNLDQLELLLLHPLRIAHRDPLSGLSKTTGMSSLTPVIQTKFLPEFNVLATSDE